jgi:hypothetical protein
MSRPKASRLAKENAATQNGCGAEPISRPAASGSGASSRISERAVIPRQASRRQRSGVRSTFDRANRYGGITNKDQCRRCDSADYDHGNGVRDLGPGAFRATIGNSAATVAAELTMIAAIR